MAHCTDHLRATDEVIEYKGKIIGIIDEDEAHAPRKVASLFVEDADLIKAGFGDDCHALEDFRIITLWGIEHALQTEYDMIVRREPWPGRRGL